jgi:hypothetical protein
MSNTRVVDQQSSALRHTRRWQTAARRCPRALRDYDGSLYRTVRRVLLKPSLKSFVRTRRQCRTVEGRRQCLDAFRIRRAGRSRISLLSDAQHRAPRAEALARMYVRVEPAVRQREIRSKPLVHRDVHRENVLNVRGRCDCRDAEDFEVRRVARPDNAVQSAACPPASNPTPPCVCRA